MALMTQTPAGMADEPGRMTDEPGRITDEPGRMPDEPSGPVMKGDPGEHGRFGPSGGRFVPEALVPAGEELDRAFRASWVDPGFRDELAGAVRDYAGRPT